MQFSTFALSALSIGSALAASGVTVHVVKVGSANGTLAYFPNSVVAAVGDMVQFQFAPANHTVTQSTFDAPCQPIALNSATKGIYSGFMATAATDTMTPTYTIQINNTTPIWLYCSQGKHCMNGMTMVINQNTTANASRTIENFAALAKQATANLPGTAVADGTAGSVNSTSTTSSDSGASSSASTTAGAAKSTSTSGATLFRASEALSMGGLLAGLALLL